MRGTVEHLQEKQRFTLKFVDTEYHFRYDDGVWYISSSKIPESVLVNPNQALEHIAKGEEVLLKIEKIERKITDIFLDSNSK